jgi:replicative DNA helicase
MGKTALATNVAFNIAQKYARAVADGNVEIQPDGRQIVKDGAVVGFFSLEMSAEQLASRVIAEQTKISSDSIRKGNLTDEEYTRLFNSAKELQSLPLYIDHTGAIPISTLTARARRLKRQYGLGLIVVDYLQLVRASSSGGVENRVQEISIITQGLKALAKELEVPVLALSQLSRQVENRDDKRPQLADLRESGSIEQDADIVMFVYREEYYINKSQPKPGTEEHLKWQADMDQAMGRAELLIGKNRHGPTKTIDMAFEAQFTRFHDLVKDSHLPDGYPDGYIDE